MNPLSNFAERRLRWLTASALRSTAIFVILTFVPILLLTYYIVATSIRNAQADAANADRQVRDFAVSLLRANFRSERDALAGASDETSLERALASMVGAEGALKPTARNLRRQANDLSLAGGSLARLRRRHSEFLAVQLYDANGTLIASDPAAVGGAFTGAPPEWFRNALAGQSATSPLQIGNSSLPNRIDFAMAVPPLTTSAPPGVLVGVLPVGAVADWVRHINVGPDRYLYILDGTRKVVFAPPNGPFNAVQIAALPAAADALGGRTGSGEFVSAIQIESEAISYAPLPEEVMALLVVRPVRFGFYIYKVFYDKLALIAVIIFLLAVATGLLLRAAFRYYQRYNREVESGRSKTEALLGSIGDGVFAVDAEGRIIEFNRAAAALTGVTASAALGRPYEQVMTLSEGGAEGAAGTDAVRQTILQGRTFRSLRDLTLVRRDGSRLPITLSAAPVRDDQGGVAGCVVVFSDASQEREVDRMKNEFISIASHQLRTPMTGVKGVLSLLLDEVLGPLNPEQQAYLRRAYDSNERLIALVNDLLNISRLEQGSLQLRSEPVAVADVVSGLASDLQVRAARYQVTIRVDPPQPNAAECVVPGDAVRLREVFANLMDNAVKYTPEHGTVTVRTRAEGPRVAVEIIDTGVGIPADKMPTLFQKFNRIQNPLSGREFGTGLGLYFARSVVELHRGTIEVESVPEKGTTFRVSLPRTTP